MKILSYKFVAKSQDGFILALTLWGLAAITLGSFYFASWAEQSIHNTIQEQQDLRMQIDAFSTRSTLLFLLATQPMNNAGLTVPSEDEIPPSTESFFYGPSPTTGNELKLDGTLYQGVGDVHFSLQDTNGLFGVAAPPGKDLYALLGVLGFPAERWAPMTDSLLDYIDTDDLTRLNGAEESDYKKLAIPAPANRRLLTSHELYNVMGWNNNGLNLKQTNISALTTVRFGGYININTAPLPVLQSITSMDHDTATTIINSRRQFPFSSLKDVNKVANKVVLTDPMKYMFLPSGEVRIRIKTGQNRLQESNIILTPNDPNGVPWIVDYEISIPSRTQRTNEQDTIEEAKDTKISFFSTTVQSDI